jgi:hypothetical protein
VKIGLVGIVITALVSFFFGVASNQVSDHLKQADDCSNALSQFSVNAASNYLDIFEAHHDPATTPTQKNDAISKYNGLISLFANKIRNECPIEGDSQYLAADTVHKWTGSYAKMYDCVTANACSEDDAMKYETDASDSATDLAHNAGDVSQWGLLRRAEYVIMHLY